MNLINNGLDLSREKAEQDGTEWVFGATSAICLAQIPAEERIKYLPKGEVQFGKEDFMDCATRGLLNLLETKLNYLLKNKILPNETWFRDTGYITENGFELSDRFNAILSNTTRQGNSIKAPLDSIRKDGVIPKRMLPANPDMTFNDYHNKSDITGSLLAVGQNFLRHLNVNYEKVLEDQYPIFDDVLNVAGYAWSSPMNGVYPRIIGAPNHVWMNIKPKYYAFDNYVDIVDGDFIKQLAPDYDFYEYGYRLVLSANIQENYNGILQLLINILKNYAELLKKSLKGLGGLFYPKATH